MRSSSKIGVAVAVVTVAPHVTAQVNVEPLRQQVEHRGVGGKVSASLSVMRGNVDKMGLSGAGLVGVRTRRHLALLNTTTEYAQFNQSVVVEKLFAHTRYNFELADWAWWELFAQVEHDEFRSIRDRELVGTGARVGWRSDAHGLFFGTAWMLENTRRDQPLAGETELAYLVHRWSNYMSARSRVHEAIDFSATVYLQPRFDAFDDYRALVAVGLEFKVTEVLRTGVETSVRYESRVPEDVARADGAFTNYLAAAF